MFYHNKNIKNDCKILIKFIGKNYIYRFYILLKYFIYFYMITITDRKSVIDIFNPILRSILYTCNNYKQLV